VFLSTGATTAFRVGRGKKNRVRKIASKKAPTMTFALEKEQDAYRRSADSSLPWPSPISQFDQLISARSRRYTDALGLYLALLPFEIKVARHQ